MHHCQLFPTCFLLLSLLLVTIVTPLADSSSLPTSNNDQNHPAGSTSNSPVSFPYDLSTPPSTTYITPSTHPHLFLFTGRWNKLSSIRTGQPRYAASRWSGSSVEILSFGGRIIVGLRVPGQASTGKKNGEGGVDGRVLHSFYVSLEGGPDIRYDLPLSEEGEVEMDEDGWMKLSVTVYLPRRHGGDGEGEAGLGGSHSHGGRVMRITSIPASPFVFDGVEMNGAGVEVGWDWANRMDGKQVSVEFVGGLWGGRGNWDGEIGSGGLEVEAKAEVGKNAEELRDAVHEKGSEYITTEQYLISERLGLRHWHITPPFHEDSGCLVDGCVVGGGSEKDSTSQQGLLGLAYQYFLTDPIAISSNPTPISQPTPVERYRFPKLIGGAQVNSLKPHYIVLDIGVQEQNILSLEEYRAELLGFLKLLYREAVEETGAMNSKANEHVNGRKTQVLVMTRDITLLARGGYTFPMWRLWWNGFGSYSGDYDTAQKHTDITLLTYEVIDEVNKYFNFTSPHCTTIEKNDKTYLPFRVLPVSESPTAALTSFCKEFLHPRSHHVLSPNQLRKTKTHEVCTMIVGQERDRQVRWWVGVIVLVGMVGMMVAVGSGVWGGAGREIARLVSGGKWCASKVGEGQEEKWGEGEVEQGQEKGLLRMSPMRPKGRLMD